MRPARIILLVVALLAGGLAAYLATRGGSPETTAETTVQIREEPRTRVLIATGPIGLGQRLTPDDVSWQDWPEGAVRPEYITDQMVPDAPQQISGSVARFEIFTGEPIREAKLVQASQGYMSAVIGEGMRAVSVGVTAELASGGYIVPNDRVDVVLTRTNSGSGSVSETILANVRVLAIGDRLGETGTTGGDGTGGDPRSQVFESSQIATLELSPIQAETVLNAGSNGRLALVLRSIVDFDETVTASAGRSQAVRLIRYGADASVMAGALPDREAGFGTELGIEEGFSLPPALPNVPFDNTSRAPAAPMTPLEAANPLALPAPATAPQTMPEAELR